MNIAVASADGKTISPHFGRSRQFLIFQADGGHVSALPTRDNTYTPHAKGECKGDEQHGQDHPHHDAPHSHASVVAALADCQVVLCGGMGWRAAEELQAAGVRAIVVDPALSPQQAVADLIAGRLQAGRAFCRCHE